MNKARTIVIVSILVVVGIAAYFLTRPTTTSPTGLAKLPENHIDLLRLISLPKDIVAGADAKLEQGQLLTPSQRYGRVLIPYVPPEEYDLTIIAQRVLGSGSLNIGLCGMGQQFVVALESAGQVSGLELVDGQPFNANSTTRKGQVFTAGINTIECQVRKTSTVVRVNGNTIIEWKGAYEVFSLFRHWEVPFRNVLFIGSFETIWRVHSLSLKPVSGQGKVLH